MSESEAHQAAARLLDGAARRGKHVAALPEGAHPVSVAEAHAIQDLVVSFSEQQVAGWKVATNAEGVATWGAIYERDCFPTPATVEAARMPLMGVEGEIAFRFTSDLPARAAPYSRAEIAAVLVAFPAIEIVDSRFESYKDTPAIDRLADRMSNGGMVIGTAEPGARAVDLSSLHVVLMRDDQKLVDQVGGHSRGDPLLPVIDFIHARQLDQSFRVGQFITAGTFTGLVFGQAGQKFTVTFEAVGSAALSFV